MENCYLNFRSDNIYFSISIYFVNSYSLAASLTRYIFIIFFPSDVLYVIYVISRGNKSIILIPLSWFASLVVKRRMIRWSKMVEMQIYFSSRSRDEAHRFLRNVNRSRYIRLLDRTLRSSYIPLIFVSIPFPGYVRFRSLDWTERGEIWKGFACVRIVFFLQLVEILIVNIFYKNHI